MNIFFSAQSSSLSLFHDLDIKLREDGFISESAYWISNSEYYFSNKQHFSLFHDNKIPIIYEWDCTNNLGREPYSNQLLKRMEIDYGEPYLWNAIVSDRRLMYGPLCKSKQQYKSRFSHDQLCEILFRSLSRIEQVFDKQEPNLIVSYVPTTFGDYLLYLVAKSRGISFLHLKSTKVLNYYTLSESINENPEHIYKKYAENYSIGSGYPFEVEANKYIQQGNQSPMEYEGNISVNRFRYIDDFKSTLFGLMSLAWIWIRRLNTEKVIDNYVPPPFGTLFIETAMGPIRGAQARIEMKKRMISLEQAKTCHYLFFPLQSEPEVAISVYGRNHQNQIETIRRISQSIPVTWKLLIKEHPRTFRYRSKGYYKKLLEIPNVYFAEQDIPTFFYIKHAKAVTTISGFVGLEALVQRKPLMILGDVIYNIFPRTMAREIRDFEHFPKELNSLLEVFKSENSHIKAFLAACMSESVKLNLYTDFFQKVGRTKFGQDSRTEQLIRIADYLKVRYKSIQHTQ